MQPFNFNPNMNNNQQQFPSNTNYNMGQMMFSTQTTTSNSSKSVWSLILDQNGLLMFFNQSTQKSQYQLPNECVGTRLETEYYQKRVVKLEKDLFNMNLKFEQRVAFLENIVKGGSIPMNTAGGDFPTGINTSFPNKGVFCDEMVLKIHSSYGRDQYTAFGKAKLMGTDGVNYGLNMYGKWSASSVYVDHNKWGPNNLGMEKYPPGDNIGFLCFNQLGEKTLTWKSNCGGKNLEKFLIHARKNKDGPCNKDLPKDVTFSFLLNGKLVKQFKHQYPWKWGNGHPKDCKKFTWVNF